MPYNLKSSDVISLTRGVHFVALPPRFTFSLRHPISITFRGPANHNATLGFDNMLFRWLEYDVPHDWTITVSVLENAKISPKDIKSFRKPPPGSPGRRIKRSTTSQWYPVSLRYANVRCVGEVLIYLSLQLDVFI